MSSHVIAVDAVALIIAAIGFHLAFRQRLVRRLWSIARKGEAAAPPVAPELPVDQDPVRYALVIAGTMIMAFGILIATFTTVYGS